MPDHGSEAYFRFRAGFRASGPVAVVDGFGRSERSGQSAVPQGPQGLVEQCQVVGPDLQDSLLGMVDDLAGHCIEPVSEGDGSLPVPCGRQQQAHQAEQVVGNGAQHQVYRIGPESAVLSNDK